MRRLTTDEFIRRAKNLHGDLYDYSKADYVDMHTHVEIICKKHGSFFQSPSNHLKGHGCFICNKRDSRVLGVDEFISRSINIHGLKYDYSQVVYVNSKTDVEIICPIHGLFFQKPEKHMIGQGCPFCAVNHKDDTKSFIEKAKLVHGDLYDYSKVDYVDQHTKVCIIDPKYGEFWQQPNSHLNGRGSYSGRVDRIIMSKVKNKSFNASKAQNKMFELLVALFGMSDVFREYKSDTYPFCCDFYVRSLMLYIELNAHFTHGFHWFDSNNSADLDRLAILKERSLNYSDNRNLYCKAIDIWTRSDLLKREYAIKNDLNYVVFWRDDLKDFMDWYNNFDFNNPVLKLF